MSSSRSPAPIAAAWTTAASIPTGVRVCYPGAVGRLGAQPRQVSGEANGNRRDPHRRAVPARALAIEDLRRGLGHRYPGLPQLEHPARPAAVPAVGVEGVLESPREMLLLDPSALDQRLGQRDHHLGVVGVGAPPQARLDHLHLPRDRGECETLERHATRRRRRCRAERRAPDRRPRRRVCAQIRVRQHDGATAAAMPPAQGISHRFEASTGSDVRPSRVARVGGGRLAWAATAAASPGEADREPACRPCRTSSAIVQLRAPVRSRRPKSRPARSTQCSLRLSPNRFARGGACTDAGRAAGSLTGAESALTRGGRTRATG